MKTKNEFLLPALIAAFSLISADQVTAQTFATLHTFAPAIPAFTNTDGVFYNNSDGAAPDADLLLSGNTLFWTTYDGGNSNSGTVFKINTDGTGFTTLHRFTQRTGPDYTNSDGSKPAAVLVLSGDTLYGAAGKGGSSGKGAIFAVNTDGSGFTNLHSFTALDPVAETNADGAIPWAGMVVTNNTLYGTASGGGSSGNGTVFAINTDGSGFTTLHNFTAVDPGSGANSDGVDPEARLILSGSTLYGTSVRGGSSGNGTVFKLSTDGTGFTNLHSLNYSSDGGEPNAGLVLSGNSLYSTAQYGGSSGNGTVFKVNTDGSGFAVLHSFAAGNGPANSDGMFPGGGLIFSVNRV